MILIGYGDLDYDAEVTVYAGDGNDLVDIHGRWHDYLINGGRGNDTFIVDGGYPGAGGDDVMKIDGGLGDDTITQGALSAATNAAGTKNLSATVQLYGGEGNDKFDGFTGTTGTMLEIFGGAGNDKIVSGTGFGAVDVDAGDGDDVVYDAEDEINDMAVREYDLGAGDDVFFGGRDGQTIDVDGGDGDDKIFGPNDVNDGVDGYGSVMLEGGNGDDIIDHGDYGYGEYGFGGDGNDKIIGGLATYGARYEGNAGDDKIWMINPEQRGLEQEPGD